MIKKIFLIHHTHTDIGYTDLQGKILCDHIEFFDKVLEYCKKTEDYPQNAQFRWTCENLWMVQHYFENRPKKIKEFIKLVKKGRIEVTGFYFNLTELYSLEMLIRSLYFLRELKEKYGIYVVSAMNCDINGLSWRLPQILNKVGIKYLLMATDEIRSFAPGVERPFWWAGNDDGKVLVWNAGRKYWYAEGVVLGFGESYKKVQKHLPLYLEDIEKNYPYDTLCLQMAMDNQPPILKVCDIVREWNEKERVPEIIVATPQQFFQHMEKSSFSGQFPEYKLAWPDWWADGNASCAIETAICINTGRKVIENEAIHAFLNIQKGLKYPSDELKQVWENLFLFAEHTFGAHQSIKEPFSHHTLSQWAVKSNFVYSAAIENDKLYKDGLNFLENNFPNIAKGEKTYLLQKKPADTLTIENCFYRVHIDGATGGITTLYDKQIKEELVDIKNPYRFNQYIYENIASMDGRNALWDENSPQPMWSPERKKTPLFRRYDPRLKKYEIFENRDIQKIVLNIRGKGCSGIISEITLDSRTKKIEISNTLFKDGTFVPEAVYFAFPFSFTNPELKISGPGGAEFKPGKEQLPLTAGDYYSVEDWVVITDERKSIIWISPDAPLVQFSEINTGRWLKNPEIKNGTLFSFVINNYWFTNFKATQQGKITFRYAVTSQKREVKNSDADDFSSKYNLPVFNKIKEYLFKLNKKNISVLSFKKTEDNKGYILRLRETDGIKTVCNLKLKDFKKMKVFLAGLTEEKQKKLNCKHGGVTLALNSFEILTLFLEI